MFIENNLIWISVFITQIVVLNLVAANFHSLLFHITGLSSPTGSGKFSAKIAGFFLFTGTLIHELSHILMAAILFVRVKALNIKTETTEDKHIKFGTAEVELVDPFRNSLVGIAPLLFGVALIYILALGINFINFGLLDLLKLFLISQISNTMFLSRSDTKYFKYVFILFIVLYILIWLVSRFYYLISIDYFNSYLESLLFSNSYVSFLKNINFVFLLVIIFNSIINFILKTLSKYKRY